MAVTEAESSSSSTPASNSEFQPSNGAHYLAKCVLPGSVVLQVVQGHIRSPSSNDIVFGKETSIELVEMSEDGVVQSICEQPVFGIIKDMAILPRTKKLRTHNSQVMGKDMLLIISDSGKLSFLTFCNEMHRFFPVTHVQLSIPGNSRHQIGRMLAVGALQIHAWSPTTEIGSSNYMTENNFTGILSNNESLNPDFYNWNRVMLRYCDGASFAGNSLYENGTSSLYFRGQKIWHAIIYDLLPQGLAHAEKALLSGCSAGGLAVFLHCDNFSRSLPGNASVKCISDAGFFLDVKDVANTDTIRTLYHDVVSLRGVEQNLN